MSKEDKFEQTDFNLFEALTAIDKKDYGYFEKLTTEQQRRFVPFMMLYWTSCVKGSKDLSGYYLMSTEYHANKYMFNESVQKHPKLQWLMLCAASPGIGKQFHQYIPHIKEKVSKLREVAKQSDIEEFYKKIYPKANATDLKDLSKAFVTEQKRKVNLSKKFPSMKLEDIEALSEIVTDEMIEQYERDSGN